MSDLTCPHGAEGDEIDLCPPCSLEAARQRRRLIEARKNAPSTYFGSTVVHRGREVALNRSRS